MRLLQIIKYAFKYRRRIKAHIKRVQYFYTKIVYADMIPMMKDIDIDRVMNHDKDKLKLKNLVRQAFRYIPGPLSDKEKLAIHNVVMEHIKSNKHHCEYWSDGGAEPKLVKMELEGAPIGVTMWIQMLPSDENTSRLKVTLKGK